MKNKLNEKTLLQLVDEFKRTRETLHQIGEQVEEIVTPGTILKLEHYLSTNFSTRKDQSLTEEDFKIVTVIEIPHHGFSFIDVEGSIFKGVSSNEKEEMDEGLPNPAPKANLGAPDEEDDEEFEDERSADLDDDGMPPIEERIHCHDEIVQLIMEHPGAIIGHTSNFMARFISKKS